MTITEAASTTMCDMLRESNRLLTFKKWVFKDGDKCSAGNLAKAGFYFIGSKEEPDAVQCFLCEKPLDGWEPNDDPWLEHIKHSSECSFAKLRKEEDAMTYDEFLTIKDELIMRVFEKYAKQVLDTFDKKFAECKEAVFNN